MLEPLPLIRMTSEVVELHSLFVNYPDAISLLLGLCVKRTIVVTTPSASLSEAMDDVFSSQLPGLEQLVKQN